MLFSQYSIFLDSIFVQTKLSLIPSLYQYIYEFLEAP